jgi:putative transposase
LPTRRRLPACTTNQYDEFQSVVQVGNLRPIGNRPENFVSRDHFICVTSFHSRCLPHYYSVGRAMFLTWRLHGSLPKGRAYPSASSSGKAFLAMDRILDNACTGPLYLRQPEIAEMVVDAIHYREHSQYQLHAYVVMANHVHLLITPLVEVSRLMKSLKRFTAREGNRILGLTGRPFWQDESYDRMVRDATESQRITRYIEMNPVKAGIVAVPEEFPWSSAGPIANRPQAASLHHNGSVQV